MKTRKAIILTTIISSLFINMNAKAQFTDTIANSKNNYFFISPLSLIDVINPVLTVGYERKISERFAFQIEGGPILKHSLIGFFLLDWGLGQEMHGGEIKAGKFELNLNFSLKINQK